MPLKQVPSMTPEEFAERGKEILGTGWQQILGQAISVSNGTISRWVNRKMTLPEYAIAMLELMHLLRRNRIPLPERFSLETQAEGDAENLEC